MDLRFSWDERKAQSNLRKHGVRFEEAMTVFGDINSLTVYDERHSGSEDRYIMLGGSSMGRLLVVVYSVQDESIRLISCREATLNERRQYEQ